MHMAAAGTLTTTSVEAVTPMNFSGGYIDMIALITKARGSKATGIAKMAAVIMMVTIMRVTAPIIGTEKALGTKPIMMIDGRKIMEDENHYLLHELVLKKLLRQESA